MFVAFRFDRLRRQEAINERVIVRLAFQLLGLGVEPRQVARIYTGVGGQVADRCRVRAAEERVALELVLHEIRVCALVPRDHVHPRHVGVDPHVQVLGQKVRHRRRHLERLRCHALELLGVDRDAVIGVGLLPRDFRHRIVVVIDRVNDTEERFVDVRIALDRVT